MRPNFSTAIADQRAHLFFDRDVGLAEDAGGAELFGQRLALRRAAAGDHDFCALRDKDFGGPLPDAAGRAGDHRNLAVKPSHVMLPVLAGSRCSNISRACVAKQAMLATRRLAKIIEALELSGTPVAVFALCSALFWIC